MSKYIDADKLIHDLEERIFAYSEGYAEGDDNRKDAIETLLKDVKYQYSLQQEQPEKPVPKDLEEAAEKYAYGSMPDEMKSYVKPVGDEVIKNFIAGAKWQKEQMMKEAVEHYVVSEIAGRRIGPAIVHFDENFIVGDKVRVIICKKED